MTSSLALGCELLPGFGGGGPEVAVLPGILVGGALPAVLVPGGFLGPVDKGGGGPPIFLGPTGFASVGGFTGAMNPDSIFLMGKIYLEQFRFVLAEVWI